MNKNIYLFLKLWYSEFRPGRGEKLKRCGKIGCGEEAVVVVTSTALKKIPVTLERITGKVSMAGYGCDRF
jgi:hypothetical protein